MRKVNAFSGIVLLILFLIHAAVGSLQAAGYLPGGNAIMNALAWALIAVIGIHAVIGVVLTVQTLTAIRKSGASYFAANRLFWARRLSGFAMLILIVIHTYIFMGYNNGAFRLRFFGPCQLICQILLVLTLAVHLTANIRPSLISLGIRSLKAYAVDILAVLSVVCLVAAGAFVVYFLRWL